VAEARAMVCLVCAQTWPAGTPRCTCGYDLETRDPRLAIERLSARVRRGNRIWRRGLAALVLLPAAIFLIDAFPTAVLVTMVQLMCSVWWIVQGLVKSDVAGKRLATARQLALLPAARVIERPKPRPKR
jgi:hypothetical protein